MIIQIALGIVLAPIIGWALIFLVGGAAYTSAISALILVKIIKRCYKYAIIPIILYSIGCYFHESDHFGEILVVLCSIGFVALTIPMIKALDLKRVSTSNH